MRNRLFLIALSVVALTLQAHADDWKQRLIRQGIQKYKELDEVNSANIRDGKAFLNEYIIELNDDWVEERPDKIILAQTYKSLSTMLRNFNNHRKDGLRFYIVVVNDYCAYLDETVSFNTLPSRIESLKDYVQRPDTQIAFNRFRDEIATIPAEIMSAMGKYDERIVYFYASIKLYKHNHYMRYKYDNLGLQGGRLDQLSEDIRSKSKSGLDLNSGTGNVIQQVATNIINSVKVVVDGEGNGNHVIVDCSKSLDEIVTETQSVREAEYEDHVKAFVSLLDNPAASTQSKSQYLIFDDPESLNREDLFNREVLPDKLNLLADPRYSNYRLYVVFKEIPFAMNTSDWPKFAKEVFDQSSVAKQPLTIVMVVPYLRTICTGEAWLTHASMGAGRIMPAVFGNDVDVNAMNSALALDGLTWEAAFNQAFTYVPKAYHGFRYAVLYDFKAIRYEPVVIESTTGYDKIFDFQLYVDNRLQEHVDAKAGLARAMDTKEPSASAITEYESRLRMLPDQPADPYLLKHGLKESALAEVSGSGNELYSIHAEQYVRWFVAGKAADAESSGWSSMANALDGSTDLPPDEAFITGTNGAFERVAFNALDAAGVPLSFMGLDWVTDGAGFLIASYYYDINNQIVYGVALAIPVSAIVIKAANKGVKWALKKTVGGQWELVVEVRGVKRITEGLAAGLTGSIKSTYDDLINAGLVDVEVSNSILLRNMEGETVAIITDGKLRPAKWGDASSFSGTKINTTEGYVILKNGSDIKIDLGFKEGRVLTAEEVNDYLVNIEKAQREGQPYLNGTLVTEKTLTFGKIFVVEYASQKYPGGWGSNEKVASIWELRNNTAVLQEWKNEELGDLVVREYEVVGPLRVRDGIIGPQTEKTGAFTGEMYQGGNQQYQFLEGKFTQENPPTSFLKFVSETPIK